MTSTEALERIKDGTSVKVFNKDTEEFLYRKSVYDEYIERIEKDLELLKKLKELINGLEDTFNRPGISNDTNILGTIIRDYFIDNIEEVKEWLNEK